MLHHEFFEDRAIELRRDAAERRLANSARPRRRLRRLAARASGDPVSRT